VSVEFRIVDYDFGVAGPRDGAEQLPPEFVATIRSGWWTTCLENLPAKERREGRY